MKNIKTIAFLFSLFLSSSFLQAQDCVSYTMLQDDIGNASETFGVSLADFNNDGFMDVVIVDAYDDIEVYFGIGGGNFNTTALSLGGEERARFGVQVLDIENDGDIDFVVSPFYNESWGLEIWENNGSGSFTLKQDNIGTHTYGEEFAVGDLNNDGFADIFYPHRYGIDILLNNQSGVFSSNGQDLDANSAISVVLADLDNDSDLDAVIASSNGSPAQVLFNDGSGIFSNSGQELSTENDEGVAAGDIDGDGDIDVVFAPWHGVPQVWVNDGIGSFMPGETLPGSDAFHNDIIIADQNFDGYPDIFTDKFIYLNVADNPGTFEIHESFGVSTHDFEVIDINNDHLLDIYIGRFSSDNGDIVYLCDIPTFEYEEVTICAHDSMFLQNAWQTEAGVYFDNLDCELLLQTTLSFYDEINNEVTEESGVLIASETDAEYQWLDCDNDYSPIPGETSQTYIPTEIGNFAVEITKNESCIAISDCYSYNYVNINQQELATINISPNPSLGIFVINLPAIEGDGTVKIKINNVAGKEILCFTSDQKNPTIDISNQPKGIYFLTIQTPNISVLRKINKN